MVYCSKCGAEMSEDDKFCTKCGAPAEEADSAKKDAAAPTGGGKDAKKYERIGIAAIAVVVLFAVVFVVKGIGKKDDSSSDNGAAGQGREVVKEDKEEEEVLKHLKPWMGEWRPHTADDIYEGQRYVSGFGSGYDEEGYYYGHIFLIDNFGGIVHVTEDGIDFTDAIQDEKFNFPISSLTYSKTAMGADAFEVEDRDLRIIFYSQYNPYENKESFGDVIRMSAYVGTESAGGAAGHVPDADGWATDIFEAFIRLE